MNIKNGKVFKNFIISEDSGTYRSRFKANKITFKNSLGRIGIYIYDREDIDFEYEKNIVYKCSVNLGGFTFDNIESDYMFCEEIKRNKQVYEFLKKQFPFDKEKHINSKFNDYAITKKKHTL